MSHRFNGKKRYYFVQEQTLTAKNYGSYYLTSHQEQQELKFSLDEVENLYQTTTKIIGKFLKA